MLIDELEPLFDEIATLLGELEGNERAWEVLGSEEERTLTDGWMRDTGYFTIPGTYSWETQALYVAMHPSHPDWMSAPLTNAERQDLVQRVLTEVCTQSRDQWARSAVPTVYRSACRNVWEPNPERMAESVGALSDVVQWLADQVSPYAPWKSPDDPSAPGWLGRLREHWPATSESSQSFYDFWNDVNDKCSLYLHAAARLAAGSAQVATTIADFQGNLLEVTTRARDQVRTALHQWQVWREPSGTWPTGEWRDSDTPEILGGVSYLAGVISLYPPAAVVAGPISVATGTLSYTAADKYQVMEATQAATASEIHNGFVRDLRAVETGLANALDGLRSTPQADGSPFGDKSLQTYAAEVTASRTDWRPPPVNL